MTNYATHLNAIDARYHLHSQTNAVAHQSRGALMLTGGDGVFVSDVEGRRYLESMSGLWYANLGFSNQGLVDAAHAQLQKLPAYHTFNHRSNDVCAQLSEKLAQIVPLEDARLFYVNSGSEAIDSMVKMAWYYHMAEGNGTRRKIISRQGAFHGSSIYGAVVGGLPHMKDGFNLPKTDGVVQVSCPSYYRNADAGETEAAYCDRLIDEVADVIAAHGADTIAAMIAEPIIGAGGVLTPPKGYFSRLSTLLQSHGILLLMDEVICGFGRTGNWFGAQTYGAQPDMIATAKGLTAGYIPMGAVAISGRVYEAIAAQSDQLGVFGHGFTYSGHPTASAVALAALEQYHKMDAPALTARRGQDLRSALTALATDDMIGDVRVEGFIAGIELVANKADRTPFAPELSVGRRFENNALREGLIVRNMGDTIALCPPYIMTDDEFYIMINRLRTALHATRAGLCAAA
ncbi:4-aminobutyrate---pyruvate transaminase [Aliiroseovarius crassostreae]|uniref:aminotransferase n=1 Tax=Aliiroseovarius crassostreae TaxID=154981 RepID=UPI0008F3B0F4|nr:aminotransferase [Aliiroseovarius crassostreae]SFU74131.1 4-aminobutyrate---pyruvate transaminase [Aliiroseovarius crassostreae]